MEDQQLSSTLEFLEVNDTSREMKKAWENLTQDLIKEPFLDTQLGSKLTCAII